MKPSFSKENCSDPPHSNLPSQRNSISQEGQISAAAMATGHCPHWPEPWVLSCPSWMMEYGLAKWWSSTGEAKKGAQLSGSPHPTPTSLVTLALSQDSLHLSRTWRKKVGPRGVSECLCPELERSFGQDFQATGTFLTGFGRSQTIRWLHSIISPWGRRGCAIARFLVKCCFGWNQGAFPSASPGLKEAGRNTRTAYFGQIWIVNDHRGASKWQPL